jgi:Tfp pilus assembly protein PilP
MTLDLKLRMNRTAAPWLLSVLVLASVPASAQDDIDQPAGDIVEAEEDPPPADSADMEIPADGSPMNGEESAETPAPAAPEGEAEDSSAPIGPVWESYNSNLKSVAQEVTKGIRVEDVVEPPSEYHYAAFGKPDPFIPPMIASLSQEVAGPSGLEVPIVSPLQRFPVNELRVVGIWQLSSGERKALVMTPGEGGAGGGGPQGIIVRNGDSIGNRAGKILAIGETVITVREFRLAADGTRQYEDVQMLMGTPDPNKASGKLKFTPGAEDAQVIMDGQNRTASPVNSSEAAARPSARVAPAPVLGRNGLAPTPLPGAAPVPAPQGAPAAAQPAAAQPVAAPAAQPAAVPAAQPVAVPATAPQNGTNAGAIPGDVVPGQPVNAVPAGIPAP